MSLLTPTICSGERFDFPGCTILPGLIDTHVQLVMSALDTNEAIIAQVTRSEPQLLARIEANALAALRSGLTTVAIAGHQESRPAGARPHSQERHRRPDILACGAPITTTPGHCHWLGLIADSAR